MASAQSLKVLRELQSRPDNKICVDCEAKHPQWATVSYGTFMCLECSGKHRGLGVHLSFVRSVTMDAWTPEQLLKMQAGGNGKCNAFLKQYGIEKHTDIREKYNSQAAEFLREKVKAEVEKRPYTPPPPSSVRSPAKLARGGRQPSTNSAGQDEWGEWGDGGSSRQANSSSAQNSRSASPALSGGNYSRSDLEASASNKDQFFASRMEANAGRPEGLPPSQGGKYVGFGSGGSAPPRPASSNQGVEQVTTLLSTGWNQLSTAAGTAVTQVRSNEEVQQTAKVVAEKGKEYSTKTWGFLRGVYANAAKTVESVASEQGYHIDLGAKNLAQQNGSPSGMHGRSNSQPQLHHDMNGAPMDSSSLEAVARQHSASGPGGGAGSDRLGTQNSSSRLAQSHSTGGAAFAGFEDGTMEAGWDDHWDTTPKAQPAASKAAPPATLKATESDDWGKW